MCPPFGNPRVMVGREVENSGASNVRKIKFQGGAPLKSNWYYNVQKSVFFLH